MKFNKWILVLTLIFSIVCGFICKNVFLTSSLYVSEVVYDENLKLNTGDVVILDGDKVVSSLDSFNRYKVLYSSDVYVKGVITYTLKSSDGSVREENERFFLEPKGEATFSSFINGYIDDTEGSNLKSITFENIDEKSGNFNVHSFELVSFVSLSDLMTTISGDMVEQLNLTDIEKEHYIQKQKTVFIGNTSVKLGLSLKYGGSINYISGNSNIFSDTFANVNLINSNDNGRFIQQCYYGNLNYSNDEKYVSDDSVCNSVGGLYNPIQGGFRSNNDSCGAALGVEYNSKIVDIGLSDDKKIIEIKTKPSLWELSNEQYKSDYYDYYGGFTSDSYMVTQYTVYDNYIAVSSSYIDFTENVNDTIDSGTARSESPSVYTISALSDFYAYSRKSNIIRKYEIDEVDSAGQKHFINDEELTSDGSYQSAIWSYWGGYFSSKSGITEGLGLYRPDYNGTDAQYLHGFVSGEGGDMASFDSGGTDSSGVATSFFTSIMHLNNGKIGQFKMFEYDYVITLGNIDNVYTIMDEYRNDHSYVFEVNPNGGEYKESFVPVQLEDKLLAYSDNYWNIGVASRDGYSLLGYFDAKVGGNKVYDSSGVSLNGDYWKVNTDLAVSSRSVEKKYQYIGKKNLTVYAQWMANNYVVKYNTNGGTIDNDTFSVLYDSVYGELGVPIREGYVFKGWYLESTFENIVTKDTIVKIDSDHILYAKWEMISLNEDQIGDYILKDDLIGNVSVGTKIGELNLDIDSNYVVKTYDKDGNEKTDGVYVTGDKIEIHLNDDVLCEYTIVIRGDVDGDGSVSYNDVLLIASHLIKENVIIGNAYLYGADFDFMNNIDINDVIKLSRYLNENN